MSEAQDKLIQDAAAAEVVAAAPTDLTEDGNAADRPGAGDDAGSSSLRRLWADLVDAVRGTEQDYTVGPVGRAILLLAVPMVLETAMESIFAVVDVFFVSRVGSVAVATVGLTESLLTIIYTMAMGLSIGVTAVVARRIGEHDRDGAARAAVQAVLLGVIVSALLGVFGATYAPRLLGLMGASDEVINEGIGYTQIMLGANATVLLLFLINAAFRGAGDAVIAMRVLWVANGINIIMDPVLILGLGPFPALGVQGAAIATNLGRGTAVLMQFYLLARSHGRLRVRVEHLKVIPSIMWRVIRLSATGMLQIFISVASWVGLIRILASFGDQVLAGYTIGIRLIIFALLPSWGMANAAATMVGQSLGAEKPDRAERSVSIAGFYNMIFLGITGLLFMIFAPAVVRLFTTEPEAMRHGVLCLRIVSSGFLFFAYGMVLTQSFNGAGAPWTPTIINLFCFWFFELPAAYAMAYALGWGPVGVYIAMTVSSASLAVVSAIVFRRGKWKLKKV
jgi:putative MATE family efflux protein